MKRAIINDVESPADLLAWNGDNDILLLDRGDADLHGPDSYLFNGHDIDEPDPDATLIGYRLAPIDALPAIWERAGMKRTIRSWRLDRTYAADADGVRTTIRIIEKGQS